MAERVRARVEFFRAAGGHRHIHRQLVIVVTFPDAERQAILFEVVDAIDASRLLPGFRQRRQQYRRQNGQHGHDDEQGDEGETFGSEMPGGGFHGATMKRPDLDSS